MTLIVGYLLAAWAAGYVLGYQHQMIKTAINAAS